VRNNARTDIRRWSKTNTPITMSTRRRIHWIHRRYDPRGYSNFARSISRSNSHVLRTRRSVVSCGSPLQNPNFTVRRTLRKLCHSLRSRTLARELDEPRGKPRLIVIAVSVNPLPRSARFSTAARRATLICKLRSLPRYSGIVSPVSRAAMASSTFPTAIPNVVVVVVALPRVLRDYTGRPALSQGSAPSLTP